MRSYSFHSSPKRTSSGSTEVTRQSRLTTGASKKSWSWMVTVGLHACNHVVPSTVGEPLSDPWSKKSSWKNIFSLNNFTRKHLEFLREHLLPQIIYEHTAKVWIQRSTATSVHTKQPLEAKRSSVLQSRKSSISGSTDSTKSWKSLDQIRHTDWINPYGWKGFIRARIDMGDKSTLNPRMWNRFANSAAPLSEMKYFWWLIFTPKFWRAFSYSWATVWSAMTTSSPSTAYRSKYRSG